MSLSSEPFYLFGRMLPRGELKHVLSMRGWPDSGRDPSFILEIVTIKVQRVWEIQPDVINDEKYADLKPNLDDYAVTVVLRHRWDRWDLLQGRSDYEFEARDLVTVRKRSGKHEVFGIRGYVSRTNCRQQSWLFVRL